MNGKVTFRFNAPVVPSIPNMLAPLSIPSLELLRIGALRSLLPVRAEEDAALQDLLRLAAHALQCPMALFSLLDGDRQWIKAGFGLAPDPAGMPVALCSSTLRGQDVRVVSDAMLDPVMAVHPLVTAEPRVRFYAGTALQLDGHRIGSLCVLDRQARTLDSDGRALLLEVAHAVEQWMRSCRDRAQLVEREREFRQLAEEMPGVLYRMPLDAHFVPEYVSTQLRSFGYAPEQWTQAPGLWMTAIHPDDLERVFDEQAKGFAMGKPFEMRYRLQTASGRWVPVRDVVRILQTADGSPPMAHGVILEGGQHLVMRDRHELVLQAMPDGVLVLDEAGQIVDANPKAQSMLARSPAQLLGKSLGQLMVPDAQVERPLHDGVRWRYEHPDGRVRHFEASVGSLQHGLRVHVLRDISDRIGEEGWLRKLSQAADQASEAIVITDLQANIEYVNQAALRSSGYRREELIGQNSRILQSGMTPASRYRKLWSNLTAGKPWRGFLNNRRKDGSHYIEFAVISPVCGPDGSITHYLAVKEDITEKRRMGEDLQRYRYHLDELVAQRTEELEKARRSAEAANAAKSAFLATMSHEIRTPMNGVIGIADVLQRSDLTPHQRDLVDTMRESALALLTVIDDILDFSKIEAGRLVLEQAPMVLRQVVEKASDALQPVAAARGVHLHSFVDPALPETYVGDAARLRQIIINLVGNAIKFSAGLDRPGQVSLRVLPDEAGMLSLQVQDNGVGMSAEIQRRIFKPFVQGEVSTTRQHGGTGLGLVITQRLVGAMSGAIMLESEPDRGARFSVQLPLPVGSDAAQVAAGSRFDLAGLKVKLLLEDVPRVRDWAAYLVAAGAQLDGAPQAQVASLAPGVVLVCRPETLAAMPNEALTGMRAVLVRQELRSAPREVYPGVVELDCEGLHRDDLLLAVAMAAGRVNREPASASVPRPPPSSGGIGTQADGAGRVILVVEDNDINQKVIRQQLALLRLPSEHVANGRVALQRWQADPLRYALVLTDLHMPEMDGFALARAIRTASAHGDVHRHIPVIALTANVAGAEAEKCRQAGMDAFLSKPVQVEQLRETLQRWLHRPVAAPAPLEGPQDQAPETLRTLVQPDFDDAVLQRLVGMDTEVMADLRQRYLQSLHVAVSEIASQVQRRDWTAVGLTAHRLKTSSRALGAMRLGRIFDQLETAGRLADGGTVLRLASELVGAADAAARHYSRASDRPLSEASSLVLCVDDDAQQRAWLEQQLQALEVGPLECFGDGSSVLQRLSDIRTDNVLLLADLNMPQMDGVDLIHRLVKTRFAGQLILLGSSDLRVIEAAERLAQAHGLHTLGHLPKPLQEDSLRAMVARWPQLAALRRAAQQA